MYVVKEGADQLRGNRAVDLDLCFRIGRLSHDTAHFIHKS